MARVLITGASGFAGGWLGRACVEAGDAVVGVSRSQSRRADVAAAGDAGPTELVAVDLRDGGALRETVRAAAPDIVYHLAALSSVGRSWETPAGTLQENVASAVNMLEAVRAEAPGARVVWISSCEVYGVPSALPIPETAAMAPANPYAVSKAAGEMLAGVYANAHGLDIVIARPFSHTGPGQLPTYLLSSLAHQAAAGRAAGVESLEILTGNPETRRDFTDVRDMVRAYRLLACASPQGGAVFNVSSGHSVSAGEQVSLLGELLAPIAIEHIVDPALVRAHEVMDLRGDNARLRFVTGWEPEIPLRQTMADTIEHWERELAGAQARFG